MRRILSRNLFKHIGVFGGNPPSHASLTGRHSVFALNFYRKSTSDRTNMDLSDMRKKYKGDEEVSGLQMTWISCVRAKYTQWYNLTHSPVCVTARLWWCKSSNAAACALFNLTWVCRCVFVLPRCFRPWLLKSSASQCVHVVFLHSALRRASLCLWTRLNSLEAGSIKPPSALKLERQTLCALPPPPSRWQQLLKWKCWFLVSFLMSDVSLVSACAETDVLLLVWSSWRVTATKVSDSSPTTRAERAASWWVTALSQQHLGSLWPYVTWNPPQRLSNHCFKLTLSLHNLTVIYSHERLNSRCNR